MIAASLRSCAASGALLQNGDRLPAAQVDNTTLVRDEAARQQWLTDRRQWDIPPAGASPGDMNREGHFDSGDLDPLVVALRDPEEFGQRFPECRQLCSIFTGEGTVGIEGISPLVEGLSR